MGRPKGERSRYFQDGRMRPGNTYALIPSEVLGSEAYAALPDWAARVLPALAAQFRKTNNGDLSLTWKEARSLGVSSEWKLRAGLSLLEAVGLVEVMRRGRIESGRGICSLYALGWRQIDPSDKHDVPSIVAVAAPMRWATWNRPGDWQSRLDNARRNAQGKKPDRRYARSESLDEGPPAYLVTALDLARDHPSMSAEDLAERCRISINDAHRVLQRLQAVSEAA